jgi:hypothetical protein
MKLFANPICIVVTCAIATGCNRPSAPTAKAPPPAQVKTVKEESLSTMTLTPEAEQGWGSPSRLWKNGRCSARALSRAK